jgi:WD40 repeat protein
VAISPDGKTVVTGSDDKTARLWDVATSRPFGAPLKHREAVYSVAFSPDGKYVLTGSLDGIARLWEIAFDETVRLPLPVTNHPYRRVMGVVAASFRPDGLVLATAHSDGGWLWRGLSPRPLGDLLDRAKPDHPGATDVVCSPDGRSVLVIQGKESRVWDALTGRPIGSPMPLPDKNPGGPIAAAFWPDDRTITTILKDGTIGLWQASTGQQIRTLPGHTSGSVTLAAFSPDRKTVMTAAEDNLPVVLCDIATDRQTTLPSIHRGKITALSMRPDGKVALTGDGSGMVRLWDVTTSATIGEPLRHEGAITAAAFSPDGRSIVTASADKTARLWDATTGQATAPLLENEGPVVELAFSADGKVIAARTADSVRTFARLNGQAGVKPLGPPWQRRVYDSEWEADDKGVVTLRQEGMRSLNVRVMALSPDGRKVLATCEENEARQWRVPSPLAGDPSRLKLWVEVLTARELDAGGGVHELDAKSWAERRERLQQLGGPPTP